MYQLTLAERDLYLVHIETQMEQKRRMLLEKQKTLKQIARENEYLEMVRNDYKKYYNHIVKQKEDQIRAMNYLNQYIDEIIVNGKLTDIDLENAKMEQDELIQEMAQIKSGLDEIIQLQEDAGNANEEI
jgi:intracellular sulfur oxidation DsrE/DsrF family protein